MNVYQWIGFIWFFAMGFGVGYLRGFDAGQVKGYLRGRAISRHVSYEKFIAPISQKAPTEI